MSHEHRCHCDHERLKHCRKCAVVHCLDCKTEWKPPCQLNHNYNWFWNQYPTLTSGSGLGAASTTYTINTLDDGHTLACAH